MRKREGPDLGRDRPNHVWAEPEAYWDHQVGAQEKTHPREINRLKSRGNGLAEETSTGGKFRGLEKAVSRTRPHQIPWDFDYHQAAKGESRPPKLEPNHPRRRGPTLKKRVQRPNQNNHQKDGNRAESAKEANDGGAFQAEEKLHGYIGQHNLEFALRYDLVVAGRWKEEACRHGKGTRIDN